jgi:hypothetical protein
MRGGSCPLPGNAAWKKYCVKYQERVDFFVYVLNTLHRGKQIVAEEDPAAPLNLCYFADGMCDLVSIAVLLMIERKQKPWNFTWVSGRVKGVSHIFLHDMDANIYVDLTARQFFSDMETVAGSANELHAMGYTFPVNEVFFKEHLPTVVGEATELLDKGM